MSKAPKQRKVQLHYQPYQQSGGTNANTSDVSGASSSGLALSAGGASVATSSAMDYALSDLPLHMDPVLAGFSSSLSRNMWDDWNDSDPNMVKFDMFSDDGMAPAHNNSSSYSSSNSGGFMASMQTPAQQQPQQHQTQHQTQMGNGDTQAMDVDAQRHEPSGFHQALNGLASQPRLSVKRSLSEDLVSMLDEHETHDPFVSAQGHVNKHHLPPGFSFQPQHHFANSNSANASPMGAVEPRKRPQHPQQQQQQQQTQESNAPQSQSQLVQHATDWLTGFPASNAQQQAHQQQQQQQQQLQQQRQQQESPRPLSPASAARLEAHNQRPEPTPMQRASAAIASTMVAIPNPCKEKEPPLPDRSSAPSTPANVVTPSPFSAYSFMAQAAASGEGTSENGGGNAAQNPFANANMMMPGFMMYSMPMMGNYQAAAAAAAAMGMMPMGAMPMGAMGGMGGMPMGMQMPMNPMGAAMQMGPMGPMMGMPHMMQMAASMGMPVNALGGAGGAMPGMDALNGGDLKMAPKALQPKNAAIALAPSGGGANANNPNNASFVSIARKPEEPEVSTILKSLMEEEAKKKEKKLERNRDSARESRKKQQTYVETLENGIKRLQINRDLVVSYRWGVTGGPGPARNEWRDRLEVVTGASEAFSTLQNPANFENLMRINRQRRALSLSRPDKERAIFKCFVCIGQQLAALRSRLLELQVFRNVANPASAAGQELAAVLQLSEQQKQQLEAHSSRVFAQEVLAMVKLFKVFFALRAQALRLNLMAPELERCFREVCAMEQLQKLLQWTELQRALIEGSNGAAYGLSLVST